MELLIQLQNDNRGIFDFAFIDADRVSCEKHHERMLELVKIGGIVVYDNTLWFRIVAMPEECFKESMNQIGITY